MYLWFKYLFFVKCKSISTHLDLDNDNGTQQTFPFTSEQLNSTINECLLLSHEEALTCEDFASRFFYDYFAHMLWICERTCQLDGTHSEFLCGVSNPLGVNVYCLSITENSHHFIEPFFNLMKLFIGINAVLSWSQGFQLKPFHNVNRLTRHLYVFNGIFTASE